MIESIRTTNRLPGYIEQEERSFAKSMGRAFHWIKDKFHPINVLAYCLFPLAARCVVLSSSGSFKRKCSKERIDRSLQTLLTLGGEKISLRMPDGHEISAMYFDAKVCLQKLQTMGGEKKHERLPDGFVQDRLIIPSQHTELRTLIERMGVEIHEEENGSYINLGIPKVQEPESEEAIPGTVIYAHGSGHIFEFRRPTIGTFVLGYGMNMLVFNYSQSLGSQGKISEQATYDNVAGAYHYLQQKGVPDQKILGYGHCMGAGPIVDLASKHPIHLIADRTTPDMGEFAKRRIITILRLPTFLHFSVEWIKQVMNKCFHYDNRHKIELVRGRVALIEAIKDEMIPSSYLQDLYDHAIQAQSRTKLIIDSFHDTDLVKDEAERIALGQFLKESDLIC